ncbi:response regulator transcription factor [Schumannella luteola]|uniref:DNA-binding response OmpR family regulator n=1 Tax=Schumannella luteola TaxID=472059 RepID=A0A852YJE1_9MICO|nr:response regulator [Schumannella luteola]NYG99248.1 DNA-binding response OmpR family regulator [Schumannella luteola]TPX05632.1 response regulator transcription factor [Schumannella luteola]
MSPDRPVDTAVRILIVDEEEPITHVLRLGLELEGWQVEIAHRGADAIDRAREVDVVLLDMMLPDRLGTEVVAGMRAAGSDAHVIFLTGRDEHQTRMAAYAAGADDYVTKPFGVEEVVERVAAAARRRGLTAGSLRVDDLVLDTRSGLAWRGDVLLDLDPAQFELIRQLAEQRGTRLDTASLVTAARQHDVRIPAAMVGELLDSAGSAVNAAGDPLLLVDDRGWMLR